VYRYKRMGTCSYCYLGIKIMAKKSLSKIQIELNNEMKSGVVQRETKRAKAAAKKAEKVEREAREAVEAYSYCDEDGE